MGWEVGAGLWDDSRGVVMVGGVRTGWPKARGCAGHAQLREEVGGAWNGEPPGAAAAGCSTCM